MRAIGAAVVAAFVLVTPAAADQAGQLLAIAPSGTGLSLVSASGALLGNVVQPGALVVVDATWSPDGSRVAFSSPPVLAAGRVLYVVHADGSSLTTVTSGDADHWDTRPAWISPTELAYFHRDDVAHKTSLRIVDTTTGASRELLADADWNLPLSLQPHGSLLLYALPGASQDGLVDVRTGERQQLPPDVSFVVSWSHDGTRLAFGTADGLYVIGADGRGRRALLTGHRVSAVDWSPNDRQLVFTIADPLDALSGKFGTPNVPDVYTVDDDGAGLRRLTGMSGDLPDALNGAYGPQWWPDGSRISFVAQRGSSAPSPWVMNPDGSCETPWALPPVYASPLWRPGTSPGLGSLDCTSVITRLRAAAAQLALYAPGTFVATVRNDGTRPLVDLHLTFSTTRGFLDLPEGCTDVDCAFGTLAPGEERQVVAQVRATTAGGMHVVARATYEGGPDAFANDDRSDAWADVLPCDIVGTWGADRLQGTPHRDRICGLPGDDRIDAGAGNDEIDAGSGRDTVLAGPGRDHVLGGGGADVIFVRDGQRDVVDCGTEVDTVVADRVDVLRNCEHVVRR